MKNKNYNLMFNLSIVFLIFISLIGLVLAHGGENTNSYNKDIMLSVNGDTNSMGFFGWTLMIVIIIALILFIIWMIKNLKKSKMESKK